MAREPSLDTEMGLCVTPREVNPAGPPPPSSPRTPTDSLPHAHAPAGPPAPASPCCNSESSPRRASLPNIEGTHAHRVSSSFRQQEPSFRWARDVDGVTVLIEFLCETHQVQPGRIFRPKGEFTGSKLGAFNVRAPNSPGTTTSNARSEASVSTTA